MNQMCKRVKEFIRRNPNCSYAQIAEGANIPMSMVSGCLRILIRDGHVVKYNHKDARGITLSNSYDVVG
ncbi:transcriptional regulator [Salmonella phage Se-J]|uniref:transcriptional regulator n=1 Tax=Salmonella phage Se-J TaxID=2698910 RepID=UPI0018B013EE|nr:transcriptional regulator [Salmonella phage Se-J]